MVEITIKSPFEGEITKKVPLDSWDGTWVELSRYFLEAMKGMGFIIPEDFNEYLDDKKNELFERKSKLLENIKGE